MVEDCVSRWSESVLIVYSVQSGGGSGESMVGMCYGVCQGFVGAWWTVDELLVVAKDLVVCFGAVKP